VVAGNEIRDAANWDDVKDVFHHNGIMVFNGSGNPTMAGLAIYNNYIHGDLGINNTAYIFLDLNAAGKMPGPLIFNNLLVNESRKNAPANAYITGCGTGGGQIYGNTVFGHGNSEGEGAFAAGAGCTIENNIVWGTNHGIVTRPGSIPASDHNVFYDLICHGTGCFAVGRTYYRTLGQWRADTHQDAKSTDRNPRLNADFYPQARSSAVGLGANLTRLGIAELNSDKAGNPRPVTGPWDAGAYGYAR
jgi:hypothetical protein